MTDKSNRVTALIRELLNLNRVENVSRGFPSSSEEAEQRHSKRRKIRQELVQALSFKGLARVRPPIQSAKYQSGE
jgi:hypothetical protein